MDNSTKSDGTPADSLFRYLSGVILRYKKELPVLVSVDGVDASGKTTMADKLATHLEKSGRQIIRASIDGFHNPSSVRYRQGRESPDGYYRDSFNHELIIEKLLKPLGTGNLKFKEKVFDYRSDEEVNIPDKKAEKDAILIMDGIFLFRPELIHYWDIKVFLDAGFDVILKRVIKRTKDHRDADTEQDVIELYNRRYIPGQKLYFKEARPQEKADILIDNNDYDNPFIIRTVF